MSARSNTLLGTSSNVEHFEQLSRERDALLQSAKQADREREHALARLQELRATQKMLSNHVHVAQETLGVVHRENTMWKNEQARLQQVFQQERKEIQQCVDEGNELRAGETQRKRDFCKKTETLNDELGDLLMQQEDIRSQKMITVESVPVLLEYFQTNTVESEDRNGCDTQAGAQALADLQAAISDLTNATGSFRDEMSRKKRLEALVQQLRARALQQMSSSKDGAPQQTLSETSLIELESVWEQSWDDEGNGQSTGVKAPGTGNHGGDGSGSDPVHLQLFYGDADNADTASVMDPYAFDMPSDASQPAP